MTFILKANKHYSQYDLQVELASYPTRAAAEAEVDRLESESYVHDECEVKRASYVIIEDRTHHDTKRASQATDGDGAETIEAGDKPRKNTRPKR